MPIALLMVTYELLERPIYNRIGQRIYDVIPIEQAGFSPKQSCVDQVLSLTDPYRSGLAIYDTVWRMHDLQVSSCNFLQINSSTTKQFAEDQRIFRVIMGSAISSPKKLANGLP